MPEEEEDQLPTVEREEQVVQEAEVMEAQQAREQEELLEQLTPEGVEGVAETLAERKHQEPMVDQEL